MFGKHSRQGNFVPKPERVFFAPLDGLEFERDSGCMCGVHAVENRWNLVTPVGAGHQQEAQFIDEIRLEEGTVRFWIRSLPDPVPPCGRQGLEYLIERPVFLAQTPDSVRLQEWMCFPRF